MKIEKDFSTIGQTIELCVIKASWVFIERPEDINSDTIIAEEGQRSLFPAEMLRQYNSWSKFTEHISRQMDSNILCVVAAIKSVPEWKFTISVPFYPRTDGASRFSDDTNSFLSFSFILMPVKIIARTHSDKTISENLLRFLQMKQRGNIEAQRGNIEATNEPCKFLFSLISFSCNKGQSDKIIAQYEMRSLQITWYEYLEIGGVLEYFSICTCVARHSGATLACMQISLRQYVEHILYTRTYECRDGSHYLEHLVTKQ